MMFRLPDAIGFMAAALTAFAFLPQVVKAWRTRAARDLSTITLVAQATGVALWICYGVLIRSVPVVAANSATLALTLLLLAFKWTFAGAKVRFGRGRTSPG